MKKQILFAAVLANAILFSCSKEKIATPEEQAVTDAAAKSSIASDLSVMGSLEGWFRFDGNLKESTGKLLGAFPSPVAGADVYTDDRNGVANGAIQFNGRYNLYIPAVPHSTKMSVAAWVKYDDASAPISGFVDSQSDGPMFMQVANQYYAYNNPTSIPSIASGVIDSKWHYLVATIDGTFLKFYVDGNLVGNIVSPDVEKFTSEAYNIGFGNVAGSNWHGAIDDLRFYSRALSAKDVTALYLL